MSQVAGLGGPTPRRSGRISSKAPSTIAQSTVTVLTTGGTRKRTKKALTKAKPRKSNAYGASGRAGAAEEQAVTATGFAQAFQTQRGGAVTRDDEDEQSEDDSVDELGKDAMMTGGLNGKDLFDPPAYGHSSPPHQRLSPAHERSSPPPRVPARFTRSETSEAPSSDDDLALSLGDGSKSFGMEHEAGMLQRPQSHSFLRSSSLQSGPVPGLTWRSRDSALRAPSGAKSTAGEPSLEEEVDDAVAKEKARLQRVGPPPPKPVTQATPRLVSPFLHPASRQYMRNHQPGEPRTVTRLQAQVEPQPKPLSKPLHQSKLQVRSKHRSPEVVKQWLGQVEPADDVPSSEILEDEPEWPYLSLLKKIFWGFMAAIGVYFLALWMSAAFTNPTRKVSLAEATRVRIMTAYDDLVDYVMPGERKYNETKVILTWLGGDGHRTDHLLWSRMYKNHQEYVAKFDELDSAIEKVKHDLPDMIVVRQHPDERLEITDDFWNALLSKAKSKSGDSTWADFIRANEQKVDDLDGKPVDVSKPRVLQHMVNRDEFADIMRQHYHTVSTDVDRKILESLNAQEKKMQSLIEAETRKALVESISLQSLAQSNILANYELNLMKPNYFSVGMGALIDPSYTSTTFDSRPASFVRTMLGSIRRANPPVTALKKWEEFGECWCATPNPMKGYARVGVSLPRYMYPKQVTIEHAPMSMSPSGDIKNAPRNIELWAETEQPINQVYGSSHTECLDPGDLQRVGYVCLGSFRYNVHASNHLQTFDLDAELTVPTSRVVMQVTSNWGAPNTCIYRMRLHGEDAATKPEYDVQLND
ncbi:spindle pole body-associated protein sad1 [Stagonosporopsis vannaccii]|nr:spindle pole body-associated protein sad1 [Stagonosporopsis vannaccii]